MLPDVLDQLASRQGESGEWRLDEPDAGAFVQDELGAVAWNQEELARAWKEDDPADVAWRPDVPVESEQHRGAFAMEEWILDDPEPVAWFLDARERHQRVSVAVARFLDDRADGPRIRDARVSADRQDDPEE